MIVKKMKNKEQDKSIEYTISNIIDYINDEQELDPKRGKILYSNTLNMEATASEEIILEMTELATKSKRCKNPISHILLSFDKDYKADEEQIKSIVKDFIDDIGYTDCQTAYAVHQNTDNIHIHIAVNRIDPETYKARSDFCDVDKMHRAIAKIEAKYDLPSEPRSLYTEVDGEIVKNKYIGPDVEAEVTIPTRAREAEIRQGEKSMIRIAAEEITPILQDAKSWTELHTRLAAQGFEYVKKGGGAILIAHHEDQEIQIKPSDLARWASLKNMEKRLGAYQPSRIKDIEPRKPEPMPGVSKQILDNYKVDKEQVKDSTEAIYKEFEEQKEKLKKEHKIILDAITEYKKHEKSSNDEEVKAALEAYRIVVTEEMEKKHSSLISRYNAKLEEGKKVMPPVTDFETWLKFNQIEVDTSIHSNKVIIPNFKQTTFTHSISEKIAFFTQYHNAIQADKYRITSVGKKSDGTKIVLVLDKDKDGISKGYTPEQIINHIPYMSEFEARYEHLYFTPLSEHKHHFFIDDMNMDMILQLKQDGIQPNCIIESSKGNYQSIFTLDKIGTDNEQFIINNLASSLNRYYGDVNFCGAVHPHRAPGFYNVKPKHRQPDGTYFITRIMEAQPEQSRKLLDYMAYMDGYYTWKKRQRPAVTINARIVANTPINCSNYAIKLFMLHRNEVMRINGLTESDQDRSRIDFMIATRLRATGHTQEEVKQIIYAGNVYTGRDNKWNLEDNAERTAKSAFTKLEADLSIDQLAHWIPRWKRLENAILNPETSKGYDHGQANHKLDTTASTSQIEEARDRANRSLHHLP